MKRALLKRRPRLVPTVIVASFAMLGVKVAAIRHDAGIAFAQAAAQTQAPAPQAPQKAPAQSGAPDVPKAAPVEPALAQPAQPLPATSPAATAAPAAATPAPSAPAPAAPSGDVIRANAKGAPDFSPAELQLLQDLSKRRAELDKQADALNQRELLLKAAEQRVDEKITQLKTLQANIDASLGKVDEQEDERLKSLVHIYESMKPKEAATIFEKLDMPVLLQVLTRMKDLKTAPILAAMDPNKAREVTMVLAERKPPVAVKN